jgi:hypothetical protein
MDRTMANPKKIERGTFRSGSRTSPATKLDSHQPLYANRPAIMAVPNPATSPRGRSSAANSGVRCAAPPVPRANASTMMSPNAPILANVIVVWILPPMCTPSAFIPPRKTMQPTATSRLAPSPYGIHAPRKYPAWIAKAVATAAMAPE